MSLCLGALCYWKSFVCSGSSSHQQRAIRLQRSMSGRPGTNYRGGGSRGRSRGGGRGGGRGEQRWWDPVWRAQRLGQKAAVVERLDADEWWSKMEQFKVGVQVELVVKRNYGREGQQTLADMAHQLGLYFHAYNRGQTLVVSKTPLPNYRADLDERHGSAQKEIHMSTETERRVGSLLANSGGTLAVDNSTAMTSQTCTQSLPSATAKKSSSTSEVDATKEKLNIELRSRQHELKASQSLKAMQSFREKLPAYNVKAEFLKAVANNQVLVVSGETGCGKTTQLPQFILEEEIEKLRGADCNIICTQPRRISAISVAARISSERGENLGETVGYQIRLESKRSTETRLLFCTTGVLLRRLVQEPDLGGVSHLLVDEIHERGMNEDFLIIILRDLLPRRPDLRLVLMSATINADLFSKYFGNTPTMHIPGFTFPVSELFLEDVLEKSRYKIQSEFDNFQGRSRRRQPDRKKDPLTEMFEEVDIEFHYKNYSTSTRHSLETWSATQLDLGLVANGVNYFKTIGHVIAQYRYMADITAIVTNTFVGVINHDLAIIDRFVLRRSLGCTKCDLGFSMRTKAVHSLLVKRKLVESTIEYICRHEGDGAILVFLTGWDEITKLLEKIKGNNFLGNSTKFLLLPLHGSMPTINQREIFDRPPSHMRKIVLATNIAESSITIDDVVYVIDCGKAKETRYDALNKLACLLPSWISKASAHQRRGRAGRVQPGVCYRLYPKMIHDAMPKFQLPEILRTPLQDLCLQIKSLQLGTIASFLAKALQPPDPLSVQNAIDLLKTIGALDDAEELTPLGRHLCTLPVEPNIGKMLLMGSIFQCLDPALTIAAALSHRDPFVLPIDRKEQADRAKASFAGDSYSDHIALLRAFEAWQHAKRSGRDRSFCWENFLSPTALQVMDDMRSQFCDLLSDIGFVNKTRLQAYNLYSADMEMVCAILCAGLYPNVLQCKRRGKRSVLHSKEVGKVDIHPSSVNAVVHHIFPLPYMVYSDRVKTDTGIYVRDSTNISDYVLLLFGGSLMPSKTGEGIEMLGGYLHFSASNSVLQLIQKLRGELDKLLRRKIEEPELDISAEGKGVVAAAVELLHSQNVQSFKNRLRNWG